MGTREFDHPWMRWLATPLWRIGVLLIAVPVAASGHSTWVSLLGVVLVFISLVAYAGTSSYAGGGEMGVSRRN
jgi:hypothetical protein